MHWKQRGSWLASFFRSQLIWIYTAWEASWSGSTLFSREASWSGSILFTRVDIYISGLHPYFHTVFERIICLSTERYQLIFFFFRTSKIFYAQVHFGFLLDPRQVENFTISTPLILNLKTMWHQQTYWIWKLSHLALTYQANQNCIGSFHGIRSQMYIKDLIYFEKLTRTSQKPCQYNNKCDYSKTNHYKWSLCCFFFNKTSLLKIYKFHLFCWLDFSGVITNQTNGF